MSLPFEDLGLQQPLLQAIEKLGYEQPTPIQQAAIPALLNGRNVIGQAQTGTGKTAAFGLPLLQLIQPGAGMVQALVLVPTRELAIQVTEAISGMAQNMNSRILAVYGGQPYNIQIRQLKRGVDVVVGTPGRLLDLIRKEVLDLSQVGYLVLDEADEMLDMGFIEDIEAILSQITEEHQIALFSATLPNAVRRLADRYVSVPEKIAINPTRPTVAETEQRYYRVREDNKQEALMRLLEVEPVKSALIFARTKVRTQELADSLVARGYPVESLHGDLSQSRREYVLNRFRNGSITLLVATDVAARGLDIEDVSHVFNYDLPGDPEDYVHRIGRTGRAGRKGIAITFIHPRERSRIAAIEAYIHVSMQECKIPTQEEIRLYRDEHFIERIYERMIQGATEADRALVIRLMESSVDPIDIAMAAIQMVRAGEGQLPQGDINEPAPKERAGRRKSAYDGANVVGGANAAGSAGERKSAYGRAKAGETDQRDGQKKGKARPFHQKGSQDAGMVRLRMNLGDRQGLRPSDVVGAIAGEVGIPGRAIGEISIQRNVTFVDVSEKHVGQVLKASNGQYQLHGRPVLLTLAGD